MSIKGQVTTLSGSLRRNSDIILTCANILSFNINPSTEAYLTLRYKETHLEG